MLDWMDVETERRGPTKREREGWRRLDSWLYLGHEHLWLNLGVFLLEELPQSLRDLFPISSDQFRKHLKTSLFVSEDTEPGWERL